MNGVPVHANFVREQLKSRRLLEATTLNIKCIRNNNVEKVKNKIILKCFIILTSY